MLILILFCVGKCFAANTDQVTQVGLNTAKQAISTATVQCVVYPLSILNTLKQQTQKSYPAITQALLARGKYEFYKGFSYHAVGLSIIKTHRTPLSLFVESSAQKYIDKSSYLYPVCCAWIFALFETLLLTPIERLRIERITYKPGTERKSIFNRPVVDYFRGFNASFNRQLISIFSFYYGERCGKKIITGDSCSINLTFSQILSISMLMAFMHTALTQPFELVKTFKQQQNFSDLKSFAIWRNAFISHGFQGIYAGASANTLAYGMRYPVILYFLDKGRVTLRS